MNAEQVLGKLAGAARQDGPPLIDVTGRVLSNVAASAAPQRNTLLWIFTAASSTAAAVVAIAAVHILSVSADPFGQFLHSLTRMMG